jgi:hypothetical protein
MYLAVGEPIPDYLRDELPELDQAQFQRCSEIAILDGEVVQCPNQVLSGIKYCKDHDPNQQKIRSGIGTTAGQTGKLFKSEPQRVNE